MLLYTSGTVTFVCAYIKQYIDHVGARAHNTSLDAADDIRMFLGRKSRTNFYATDRAMYRQRLVGLPARTAGGLFLPVFPRAADQLLTFVSTLSCENGRGRAAVFDAFLYNNWAFFPWLGYRHAVGGTPRYIHRAPAALGPRRLLSFNSTATLSGCLPRYD